MGQAINQNLRTRLAAVVFGLVASSAFSTEALQSTGTAGAVRSGPRAGEIDMAGQGSPYQAAGPSVLTGWPHIPPNYGIPDFSQMVRDIDALVFVPGAGPTRPDIAPVFSEVPATTQNFSPFKNLPTFVVHSFLDKVWASDGSAPTPDEYIAGGEAISSLMLPLSGSLNGIDYACKMIGGREMNLIRMQKRYFQERGQMFTNSLNAENLAGDFFYDMLPNILAFQLFDIYGRRADAPNETTLEELCQRVYRTALRVSASLGGNYDWAGFQFDAPSGVVTAVDPDGIDQRPAAFKKSGNVVVATNAEPRPNYYQPDGAAAFAYLGYVSYIRWGKNSPDRDLRAEGARLLRMSKDALQFLIGYRAEVQFPVLENGKWTYRPVTTRNPDYEILLPYAALTAARMNAEEGAKFDTSKLINDLFSAGVVRPYWEVQSGSWQGYPLYGFSGGRAPALNDGGYAFYMASMVRASVLAPIAKYDRRFARALGIYLLHVASNSKVFFACHMPAANQEPQTRRWLRDHDAGYSRSFPYEGVRQFDSSMPGVSPVLKGDAVQNNWARASVSVYSAAATGLFGAMISRTNNDCVLRVSLDKTDFFADRTFPAALYYNPHSTFAWVEVNLDQIRAEGGWDAATPIALYDTVSRRWLTSPIAQSRYAMALGADTAAVIVGVPAGVSATADGAGKLKVASGPNQGAVIDYNFD